jgi:uncharacterized protein
VSRLRQFRAAALAVALCALAGVACTLLRTPLPWMIGPLAMMAFARWRNWPVEAPWPFRYIGQIVIGTALGLYFTPVVAGQVIRYLPLMLLGGVFALVCGYVASLVLRRLMPALDVPTAFYACVPGSATEMAVLAERYGGYQDRVAVAQSLRILIVVSTLPFIYTYGGFHGLDVYHPASRVVDPGGMALLFAAAIAGGFALARIGLPNAFMLGPLVVSIALSALDIHLSALPGWLTNVAQLVLGCSLGAKFEHDFFHTAPRFLAAVAVSSLVLLLLLAGFGWAVGWATGIHPATAILATAPGGIAEMGITARNLQLGVPMVTAFHVSRVVVLVMTASTMYRLVFTRLDRWREKKALAKEST